MRLALALLLILAGQAWSADLLILIPARDAGPTVPLANYSHPIWILWSKPAGPDQSNRLLSLPSGVDWQAIAPTNDFQVDANRARWMSAPAWEKMGFFKAARKFVGSRTIFAYRKKGEAVPPSTLLAASAFPTTPLVTTDGRWPSNAFVVATVSGPTAWDEKAKLAAKAEGRVMVVEIPDDPSAMWTRIWLEGKGWPDGVPTLSSSRVPGLVRSREAMRIFIDPTQAIWKPSLTEPPNRWLEYGHQTAPVLLVFLGVIAIYIIGLGVYATLREVMSRAELFLLRLLVLGPVTLVVAGKLTAVTSLNLWPQWHVLSLAVLFLTAWLINLIVGRFSEAFHPLWGEFAVGMLAVLFVDPAFSMFSHVLGPHRAPVSPEAFGAMAAYVVGSRALWTVKPGFRIVTAVIAGGMVLKFCASSEWLAPVAFGCFPLLIVAYGGSAIRNLKIWLPVMAVLGLISALWLPGLAYAPAGLVRNLSQVDKFNCAEQIAFLMSPTFVCFCLVAIISWIAGDKFLGHQFRRAMSFSPQPTAFFPIALCFAVAGVFIPLYLHAALATVIAGGVAVLFDAVRSP